MKMFFCCEKVNVFFSLRQNVHASEVLCARSLSGVQFVQPCTKLSFKNQTFSLCQIASEKLHALTRLVKDINLGKGKSIMKSFVAFQFNYCPLVLMLHSRYLNN